MLRAADEISGDSQGFLTARESLDNSFKGVLNLSGRPETLFLVYLTDLHTRSAYVLRMISIARSEQLTRSHQWYCPGICVSPAP